MTHPSSVVVHVQRVRSHPDPLPLPRYQTDGAAGMDLLADIDQPMTLAPLARAAVPTGLAIQLPDGYEAQVRSRSGLALKNGVMCLNSPGTIDCDYRGEVKVILANLSDASFTLKRGDRIAQLLVAPVTRATLELVESLTQTQRGAGGFGSTGS
jgi:dUTP pyrophosphatase